MSTYFMRNLQSNINKDVDGGYLNEENRYFKELKHGMKYFLELDEGSAENMSKVAQRSRLSKHIEVENKNLSVDQFSQLIEPLEKALEQGSCVLALTFNEELLECLRYLENHFDDAIVLIESPQLMLALSSLGIRSQKWSKIRRCVTQDVFKHLKAERIAQAKSTLYISFPELHTAQIGTRITLNYLGKACYFSVLEVAMCMSGIDTLMTLQLTHALTQKSPSFNGHYSLLAKHFCASERSDSSASIRINMAWLYTHLESIARHKPCQTLSWASLFRASVHYQELERDNQIKLLEAYFREWKRVGSGLCDQTYQFALARLALYRTPTI